MSNAFVTREGSPSRYRYSEPNIRQSSGNYIEQRTEELQKPEVLKTAGECSPQKPPNRILRDHRD